ncbi:MAG TPA: type I-E CRISPR-associated protein Cas5/CasD [Gammaproteobacteria bacterium]|nr:type I-E CRISPR-associated protein Cas5/CasD [Gammaproteobacteria bacterium]
MTDFLLFRLYGPMASWGEEAVGEYRPTARHPGKSAILGLIAAALGIRRSRSDALSALSAGYGVAVRVDAAGELLRDYHTVQTPPNRRNQRYYTRRDELTWNDPYTLVSQRDYRVEAAWTIALWLAEKPPESLATLAAALREPELTLYLGRKSCPLAMPLAPRIVQAASLKSAFDAFPAIDSQWPDAMAAGFASLAAETGDEFYWDECDDSFAGMSTGMVHFRRDQSLDRGRWQFEQRREHGLAGVKGGE